MVVRQPLPRWRGLIALAVVAALHLALWSVLNRPSSRPPQRDAVPTSVPLRWLPRLDRAPERPALRAPLETPPVRLPAATARPQLPPRLAPAQEPRAAGTTTATWPVDAAPVPEQPASGPSRPLDLTLPRGFSLRLDARNPAVDDPLANSARLTPEQRMARSFDLRVTEERLGDGRVRLRRGADCIVVTPARSGQLFPTDPSAARMPGTVGAC